MIKKVASNWIVWILTASLVSNLALAFCMQLRGQKTVYLTKIIRETIEKEAAPAAPAPNHTADVYGSRVQKAPAPVAAVKTERRVGKVAAVTEESVSERPVSRQRQSSPVKRAASESRQLPLALAQLVSESDVEADAIAHASRLAALDKPVHTRALAAILDESDDPLVISAAAQAIANIGNREALDILVVMAEEAGESSAVYRDALMTVSSPFGQKTLFEIARFHDDPLMRSSASTALGNYRSSDVKRKLERIAYSETDSFVRGVMDNSVQIIDQTTRPAYQPDPDASELIEVSEDIS